MVSYATALLDELMGRNRNAALEERPKQITWDDPEVCKYYMVKFCPHDLFVNTKADLGSCAKIHDDNLKKEFERASTYRKMAFEEEFIKFAEDMLADVDKRIKKGRQRLSLTQKDKPQSLTPAQQQKNEEKINMLTEKINSLVNEAEKMGIEGNVDTAQGLLKLCDQLREEKEELKKQIEGSHWVQTAEIAAAQEKQMEVCEVCGAFLIVGDAQQRIDDHLMGKQHVGYAKLKAAIEEIQHERQKAKEEREVQREKEREERRKAVEEQEKKREAEREERRKQREEEEKRKRDRDKKRSRDRDRRRSRSRDRKRSHRSRSRSRNKDRYSRSRRSRSRDRDRQRDKGRDRDRRRSNDRDRYKSRRDDDRRDRDRKHRDRSRDRGKARDRSREKEDKKQEKPHDLQNDSHSVQNKQDDDHDMSSQMEEDITNAGKRKCDWQYEEEELRPPGEEDMFPPGEEPNGYLASSPTMQ